MKLFFFGASTVQGFWDSEGGWANRTRRYFDKKYIEGGDFVSCFNLGVSGHTVVNLLDRFDSEVQSRLRVGQDAMFVFSIGLNDSRFTPEGNVSSPEEYQKNLEKLFSKARSYSQKIIFVGFTPVVDELVNPFPGSSVNFSFSTERTKMFNETLKDTCLQQGVNYIDIWNDFSAKPLEDLMFDGLHPNDKGHQMVAEKITRHIEGILIEGDI